MDEELKNRFFQQKLRELIDGDTQPFPTIICERERPEILELVREFCLFSTYMIPFKVRHNLSYVPEKLELQRVKDFGDLYIFVNLS